jgi:hypothetical protein
VGGYILPHATHMLHLHSFNMMVKVWKMEYKLQVVIVPFLLAN